MSTQDFLDDQGRWTCIRCGDCCRLVRDILPEFDRGDGTCKHLTEADECAIYDSRPGICRTTQGHDREKAFACDFIRKIAANQLGPRGPQKEKACHQPHP